MLEFLAALILAATFAALGDPEPPGGKGDPEPPGLSSVQDPPIIVSGG